MTPALVSAITGDSNAMNHIRRLHRQHLFVTRTPEHQGTYQFHSMFQSVLRTRAKASLTNETIRAIYLRAAREFASANDPESAFTMFTACGEWEGAESIIVEQAH